MKKYLLWLIIACWVGKAAAHPMPGSTVSLSVLETSLRGEAKIPLLELGNAVGDQRAANLSDPFFQTYFTNHIQAVSAGNHWYTQIGSITLVTDQDQFVGAYKEAVVQFTLTPPDPRYLYSFTFNYDVVMHQVITHSALVYIRQDWNNGIQDETGAQQIGVIGLDVPSGKIVPLQVNLEPGSWQKGFVSMLHLGMQHIKEGTDHLLFLIVLLLPSMLLARGKQWGPFGGIRYSVARLIKIVTAFTIGHSITLLAGALGWLQLPGQPVEILIAFSILVSAVHAMRPLFPGREVYMAAGFGLIHGLAFAAVLSNLELSAGKLALSILGFNLGIELMQLLAIAMIVPWLILLSRLQVYRWARITGASLAAIAALAWIIERSTGKENIITGLVEAAAKSSLGCIAVLAAVSLAVYGTNKFTSRSAREIDAKSFSV